MIDFVSIFPFNLILTRPESAQMAKLARLARMPRLAKLINVQRFKNILKSFEQDNADDGTLMQQY